MNKRIVLSLVAVLLLCFAAGTLAALDVVVPGQATPAQVVAALGAFFPVAFAEAYPEAYPGAGGACGACHAVFRGGS